MRLGQARTPENTRIYAIGDVHGCDDLLAEVHAKIGEDLARRPAADHRVVHIGDYIDRGPNSAAVIDRLVDFAAADERSIFLRGNHEDMLLGFVRDPDDMGPTWLMNGAEATLVSYGLALYSARNLPELAEEVVRAMPPRHRAFLDRLEVSTRLGDYFFCHAGIRPGIPLERQRDEDLIWIREKFLFDARDHGVVVVHGHTPADRPEVLPNRINIDTGAVFTGELTCLVLEGSEHRFL